MLTSDVPFCEFNGKEHMDDQTDYLFNRITRSNQGRV